MPKLSSISIAALCIGNGLVAVVAVGLDLTAHDVMRMYWVEVGVIGLFTALKISLASEVGLVGRTKPYKVVLFGAHYGTFWVFYTQLLSFIGSGQLVPFWLTIAALFLYAIVHAVTFKFSTWDKGELRTVTAFSWMPVPYGRGLQRHAVLLAMHAGMWSAEYAAAPVVLVAVKFVLDAPAHAIEHRWVIRKLSRANA